MKVGIIEAGAVGTACLLSLVMRGREPDGGAEEFSLRRRPFLRCARACKRAEADAALRGGPPPVPITAATAKKGNIGVYLDAIGTVTPVYTSSITPQANGMVTAVNYTEGQMVQKGDSLMEIDPRPYLALVLQAQGALERDTNLLAQAKMDLDRYRTAWARNAIQKQTLDDQEKLVLQGTSGPRFSTP
jgi:multidrug efflux pump subunit AcrA (membrane-fusion protein)